MSEEESNGVRHLMALKRYQESGAETPAPAASDPQAVGEGAAVARQPEKRRSPRFRCQGSVELREQDSDLRCWAQLTDISLHGCYVELTAVYPVGTSLHLKVDVADYQIHAHGSVRASYPLLGMGIEFTADTEDDKSRLHQLLYALSESGPLLRLAPAPQQKQEQPAPAQPPETGPPALVKELFAFFDSRPIMTREEFLRFVRKTGTEPPPRNSQNDPEPSL